jgi:L-cystine uptake protein TcyP (sodium:dicarboxylate symporter family)
MKLLGALQSDAFRRWLSVVVVAVLAGLLFSQLLNMENDSISRREQDRQRSSQVEDEDSGTAQPMASDAVDSRPS